MKSAKSILTDQNSPVCVLLIQAIHSLGVRCFEWEPPIVRDALSSGYGIDIDDFTSDKIQCGISLLTSDSFETAWETFESFIQFLTNQPHDLDTIEILEPEQIIEGMAHAKILLDGYADRLKYGAEVRAYTGQIFWEHGMYKAPSKFPDAIMPDKKFTKEDLEVNEKVWTEKDAALVELYDKSIAFYTQAIEDAFRGIPPLKENGILG